LTVDNVVKWLIHIVLCLLITYILSGPDRVTYLKVGGVQEKGKTYSLTSEKSRYICDEMA